MQSDDREINSSDMKEKKTTFFLALYIGAILVLSFEIGPEVSGMPSSE